MNVCVIGTGYVGLVTGTCLANLGHQVVCVDKNSAKVAQLKQGLSPIFELGLDDLIQNNLEAGRLSFSETLISAIHGADIVIIAVGTPQLESGASDTSYILAAVSEISEAILVLPAGQRGFRVIINKSTVPIGMGGIVTDLLIGHGLTPSEFSVVSNPEFLREGSAIHDFFNPDRIVLGGDDARALEMIVQMYSALGDQVRIIQTSLETAEMIKYASNSFLATKISFINELAKLCDKLDVDVRVVANAMGEDPRIGSMFLQPGPGFGGSCFPKDVRALLHTSVLQESELKILQAVDAVNHDQIVWVYHKLLTLLGGQMAQKRVGILGVAFKPNTDDIREAPALALMEMIVANQGLVTAYDPEAMANAKRVVTSSAVFWADNAYDVAAGADIVVVVTDWDEFKQMDLPRLGAQMSSPILFDTRNIYSPQQVRDAGFHYMGMGRK